MGISADTVTSIQTQFFSVNAAAHMKAYPLGTNCYAASRGGGFGAFAAQNSNKDRYSMALIVEPFVAAAVGGVPASRIRLGM
jgi:hypothetical protein